MPSFTKSDDLENKILDHILGGGDYTRLATVFIALFTVAPEDDGTGGTEVTGGSYARVSVTNNATNWPAASGGAKSNGTTITFPQATADWGTVVSAAIMSAASGGLFLYMADVIPDRSVPNGAVASFAVGDFDVTED